MAVMPPDPSVTVIAVAQETQVLYFNDSFRYPVIAVLFHAVLLIFCKFSELFRILDYLCIRFALVVE